MREGAAREEGREGGRERGRNILIMCCLHVQCSFNMYVVKSNKNNTRRYSCTNSELHVVLHTQTREDKIAT